MPNGRHGGTERREVPFTLKEKIAKDYSRFLNKRRLSPGHATREMDGRLVPFILASVTTDNSTPVPGMTLELRDPEGRLLDTTTTSHRGAGILRFPARKPRPQRDPRETERVSRIAGGSDVEGVVTLLHGERPWEEVRITPSQQVAVVRFQLVGEGAGEGGGVPLDLPPGDDPITRLPIDFSEDSCTALLGARTDGLLDPNNLVTRNDPLLVLPPGVRSIAGKRLPLIRRLDVIRYGEDDKRYLVRLRQEWVLLAYTLGELADVTALDPGAVVQSAEQMVSETVSTARELATGSTSTLTETLEDTLSRLGTVDSVVKTVSDASTTARASGWYIGIPTIVGYGSGRAGLDVSLDLSVTTNINTSLLVNRAVQQAATMVNEAVSRSHAVAEGTQRSVNNVVNNLAPLVTQVANALHWRVYEVYAVCTNVDAVHPIVELEVLPEAFELFTPETVRSLRPFLEPALLDRTLARGFEVLAQAAELPPLTEATIEVTVNSNFREDLGVIRVRRPARVTVTLGSGAGAPSGTATVPFGNGRTARMQINFPTGAEPERGAPLTGTLTIAAVPAVFGSITGSGTATRLQAWVDRPLNEAGFVIENPPSPFEIRTGGAGGAADVLVAHINYHQHYYFGVLAASAILFPSLRQDNDDLAGLDASLWQLPLAGFEGSTALLIDEATDSVDAATLLDDPGAGTLVQILAPGSYGEILTGLLSIPATTLHPLLEEVGTGSPFPPFPTLPPGPGLSTGGVVSTVTGLVPTP